MTMAEATVARDKQDRLSNLPADILVHIFGSLNTKQAVQSSRLSRPCRNLWTSLPTLTFDTSLFKSLHSFRKFVDKVLTCRNKSSEVKNFGFLGKCEAKDRKLFERAVDYAVSHNARSFEISLDCPKLDNRFVYNLLSRSNSIESLKLKPEKPESLFTSSMFKLYDTLYSSTLTTLELHRISLMVSDVFSGCPNLEDVTLIECHMSTALNVSGIRLSKLSILNCLFVGKGKVWLRTPKLRFLEYESEIPAEFEADDELLDLCFVSIHLSGCSWDDDCDAYEKNREMCLDVIGIMHCVCNAKSVTLSASIAKLLSMFPNVLEQEHSPFNDLKLLKFVEFVGSSNDELLEESSDNEPLGTSDDEPFDGSSDDDSLGASDDEPFDGSYDDEPFDEVPSEVTNFLLENSPHAKTVTEFSEGSRKLFLREINRQAKDEEWMAYWKKHRRSKHKQ